MVESNASSPLVSASDAIWPKDAYQMFDENYRIWYLRLYFGTKDEYFPSVSYDS